MRRLVIIALLLLALAPAASSDIPHGDAEFVFARVQFHMNFEALFQREAPWHHDYPFSEDFFLGMVEELTGIRTSPDAYQIVQLDSPEIFHYPFLYVSEPGFMELTDTEEENLRSYFNRGGFVMFDDFRGHDLDNLRIQMKRIFPDREMFRLDETQPIFNSYFGIDNLEMAPPYYDERFLGEGAQFWSMRDETDRLIMIANYNNDFGEYWEWVDRAEMPFQPAALSVRYGVNYLIYALTH